MLIGGPSAGGKHPHEPAAGPGPDTGLLGRGEARAK